LGTAAKVNPKKDSYAIVGGGISGLAAAWKVRQFDSAAQVVVFECSDRLGGVLQTDVESGYVVEQAADMFISTPSVAVDLWNELCPDETLLTTKPVDNRAFIGLGDKVVPVPNGFSMMVPSLEQPIHDFELLTDEGKQRLLDEINQPRRAAEQRRDDESLESFAVRRFGKEAFDVLIQPLVSGVYTADPKMLSMQATMQRFLDMERDYGSLIKAAREKTNSAGDKQASGARYDLFRSPPGGINQLVQALIKSLSDHPSVEFKTSCHVEKVCHSEDPSEHWNVVWADSSGSNEQEFDGIIIATPAKIASQLVSSNPTCSTLSARLATIETASSAIVVMGVDESAINFETVGGQFNGYGIIYPHIDDGQVIALSFSSNKFANRAPDGKRLLRCFIGGALQGSLVELADEALLRIAIDQATKSVGLRGEPEFHRIYRWRNCMPQYHLGHVESVNEIESIVQQLDRFALAGNSYRGVGIPACLESGFAAAAKVTRSSEPR
jgi:oxygen-dependent protoporphyrinogen oxidase